MIRYTLHCDQEHSFDSWFANAAAYDGLRAAGQVSCPACGSTKIEKSLMAPAVRPGRKADQAAANSTQTLPDRGAAEGAAPARPLGAPMSEIERAFAAMRKQIEANSEYVGMNFATEARKMHEGEAPERAIYGEAKPEEARRLLEDGVPVVPLPFLPSRKTN